MKILYVLSYLSLPIRIGPQLHCYETIQYMANDNHVDVIGIAHDNQDLNNAKLRDSPYFDKVKKLKTFEKPQRIASYLNKITSLVRLRSFADSTYKNKKFVEHFQSLIKTMIMI